MLLEDSELQTMQSDQKSTTGYTLQIHDYVIWVYWHSWNK